MKVVFVDTGIFIQCKGLTQLPWKDLFDKEDLLLMVPYAVVVEIDHHKQEGNTRRGRRARKASSLFRKIVSAEGERLTIRESSPRVALTFAPQPQLEGGKSIHGLDISVTDNRIVEEALTYAASNPEADPLFFTHDTGPMITAKRCGLKVVVVPDDWLEEPEPDERDKRIKELEVRWL